MANVNYLYKNIVASGSLEDILAANVKDMGFNNRISKIHKCFVNIPDSYFPPNLLAHVKVIRDIADRHAIPHPFESPIDAKIRTLWRSPKKAKAIIRAYVAIYREIIARRAKQSANRGW